MNDMVEVKAADLIGPALDWAVAMATISCKDEIEVGDAAGMASVFVYGRLYLPQNHWAIYVGLCERFPEHRREDMEETLRVIVAAKLGDVVQVPARLINGEDASDE